MMELCLTYRRIAANVHDVFERARHFRLTPTIATELQHLRKRLVSPLKKMTECSQWLKTVAYDLSNRQHGHREDRARNTPHPKPEGERDDDEDGVEGKPSGQKHRRYTLALNQMKSKIKTRRKQRLPERVMGQQASEKKDQDAHSSAEDRYIVQQKRHRSPQDGVAHPREPHR